MMSTNFFEYARVQHWYGRLRMLEEMLIKENWQTNSDYSKNFTNPVLDNYIRYTAKRIFELCNLYPDRAETWYLETDSSAIFNTGLFTPKYERVYAVMYYDPQLDGRIWNFSGFYKESDKTLLQFSHLPAKAEYFEDVKDLVFNPRLDLRVNIGHILDDPNNLNRIPIALREAANLQLVFEGALQMTRRRIEYDFKVATPSYYEQQIQFLLPIYLLGLDKPDIVLAVSNQGEFNYGHTCLTMDMAYSNARLLSPPTGWLAREIVERV